MEHLSSSVPVGSAADHPEIGIIGAIGALSSGGAFTDAHRDRTRPPRLVGPVPRTADGFYVPLPTSGLRGCKFQLSMIVAVVAVMVVQMAIHQVIDVIPMGHCLVAAVGAVSV